MRRACFKSTANVNSIERRMCVGIFFVVSKLWFCLHSFQLIVLTHCTQAYLFIFSIIFRIRFKMLSLLPASSVIRLTVSRLRKIELHSHMHTEHFPDSRQSISGELNFWEMTTHSIRVPSNRMAQDKTESAFCHFSRFRYSFSIFFSAMRLSELNSRIVWHFNLSARLFNSFFKHQRCDLWWANEMREMQQKTFETIFEWKL